MLIEFMQNACLAHNVITDLARRSLNLSKKLQELNVVRKTTSQSAQYLYNVSTILEETAQKIQNEIKQSRTNITNGGG